MKNGVKNIQTVAYNGARTVYLFFHIRCMFIFHLEQFYKYCPIDENDNCIKFKKSYNGNAKIVMDNHPLMIMAREEQKVKVNFSY